MGKETTQHEELAHERYKKLLLMVFGAFLLSLIVGGGGGYLIWDSLEQGQSLPRFFIFLPGLVTAIATGLPIRAAKKRWFATPEALMEASKYKAKRQFSKR